MWSNCGYAYKESRGTQGWMFKKLALGCEFCLECSDSPLGEYQSVQQRSTGLLCLCLHQSAFLAYNKSTCWWEACLSEERNPFKSSVSVEISKPTTGKHEWSVAGFYRKLPQTEDLMIKEKNMRYNSRDIQNTKQQKGQVQERVTPELKTNNPVRKWNYITTIFTSSNLKQNKELISVKTNS